MGNDYPVLECGARVERFVESSLLLLLRERPLHGYELIEWLPEVAGEGRIDVGNLYPLIADTAKGNSPSFGHAAPPKKAERLYDAFCAALGAFGVRVETGVFGARMQLELVNDGPVTIVTGI